MLKLMFSPILAMCPMKNASAQMAVLLIAISLAGCFGSSSKAGWFGSSPSNEAKGPFGEPRASGGPPRQDTSKTNGLASGGTVPGPTTGPASVPLTAHSADGFASTPANDAYRIGPLDVLDISVFQVPDLTKTVQVEQTGAVNLPLVGEVPAAGKTAQEVERDLTARLGAQYLKDPQVTVSVKESNSQRITITGAVKNPGVYTIKGRTSLIQVVAMAGGLHS